MMRGEQPPPPLADVEVERSGPVTGPCRVLVTNDDGIDSPGLRRLAAALGREHEVVVAAPDMDVSGAGTSIGRYDHADPTTMRRVEVDGVEHAWAVGGPPGLAVLAAALGAFGQRPDLVVSGINAGLNTGTSIIHSGTVGAALTGRTFGMRGLAVSLAPAERWYWETAVPVAVDVVRWLVEQDRLLTVNVNVPGRPLEQVTEACWAEIDEFGHFQVASHDPSGEVLDLTVRDRTTGSEPASDTARCLAGAVTLTLLQPIGAEPAQPVDPDQIVSSLA